MFSVKCSRFYEHVHLNHIQKFALHTLVGKNFLTLKDFSKNEIYHFLWTAADLKKMYKNVNKIVEYAPLKSSSIALIFEKLSTRTRISTETGAALMGMHPIFLSPTDIHMGVNESVEDTGRVLSRFTDIVLARVYNHRTLERLVTTSTVPVINGLSDLYHPLQLLADLLTLQEHYGYLKGLSVAWIGDGDNNMTHSFMIVCGKLGLDLNIAAPRAYQPNPQIVQDALKLFDQSKAKLSITEDPVEAVNYVDVIVTDTFVSMGREEEKEARLKDFSGYQVSRNLVSRASKDWCFLHCLPRKQDEVTDEIFYDTQRSLVWQEAENRKWSVMAVILNLLRDYEPRIEKPNFE